MKTDVLILGAGVGGLTAAYTLLKEGLHVVVIDRDKQAGGLMRMVKHKDFTVDFGYKHLYSRIPEVHRFWQSLLGESYRKYLPRTGVVYEGQLLELNRRHKGIRRGMSLPLLVSCLWDFTKCRLAYRGKPVISLEDFVSAKRGRKFTQIFSQGFDEKFKGRKWSSLPLPKNSTETTEIKTSGGLFRFLKEAFYAGNQKQEWYHPMKGSGQIIEVLENRIKELGGKIYLEHELIRIHHNTRAIHSVEIKKPSGTQNIEPAVVVSSLPLEVMARAMSIDFNPGKKELSFKRSVIMVYVFLNKKTSFPHTSLMVTCPNLQMGRITNYSAIAEGMVPPGKGCLCIEYFCTMESPLLSETNQQVFELAIAECEEAGILKKEDCMEKLVIKCPQSDPAVSWEDYLTDPTRNALFRQLEGFSNLYQINRTGTDKSTYAALMAAKAIIENDKLLFVNTTKPDVATPWMPG